MRLGDDLERAIIFIRLASTPATCRSAGAKATDGVHVNANMLTSAQRRAGQGQQGQDEYTNAHDFPTSRVTVSLVPPIGTAGARCKATASCGRCAVLG